MPWARIGEALGTTGQAVGKRARKQRLPVTPLTPERLAGLIEEGRRLTGADDGTDSPGRAPADVVMTNPGSGECRESNDCDQIL